MPGSSDLCDFLQKFTDLFELASSVTQMDVLQESQPSFRTPKSYDKDGTNLAEIWHHRSSDCFDLWQSSRHRIGFFHGPLRAKVLHHLFSADWRVVLVSAQRSHWRKNRIFFRQWHARTVRTHENTHARTHLRGEGKECCDLEWATPRWWWITTMMAERTKFECLKASACVCVRLRPLRVYCYRFFRSRFPPRTDTNFGTNESTDDEQDALNINHGLLRGWRRWLLRLAHAKC